MDPFANPFSPGAGTRPPAFIGRNDLLESYGIALGRTVKGRPGKSLMPIGLRGVGKTVLLNRFVEMSEDKELVSGFIEAPETGEFRELLAGRLRSMLMTLDQGSVSRAVKRALGALKSFTYNLPDGTSMSLNVEALVGTADSGILADDITDLLVEAGKAAQDRRRGILLAIDEVQYLSEQELGALITAIHRTVQLGLPVILVGAGLPQLPGLAGDAKSYAERLFNFPEIGSLSDNHAREVLAVPAEQEGVEFTDEALDRLLHFTHGYPYFLQEWGYHVWNVAPESPITLDHINAAADGVQAQLDGNFFRVRMDRLTPAETDYLVAMAELGAGPHRSGDIAGQLGVKVQSVAPRRSGLIKKGMIYSPSHGDTAFTVPMFDDFLRRSHTRGE
jgi:AAA ATPase domain